MPVRKARKAAPRSARKPVRKPAARKKTALRAVPSVAALLQPVSAEVQAAAVRKFEQGVLARGEAAEAGKPLPSGATHVIVGRRSDGTPILKRRRFSAT